MSGPAVYQWPTADGQRAFGQTPPDVSRYGPPPLHYPYAQPPAGPTFVVNPRRPNHALHLVLSLVTCGLWLPVWAVVAIVDAMKR